MLEIFKDRACISSASDSLPVMWRKVPDFAMTLILSEKVEHRASAAVM